MTPASSPGYSQPIGTHTAGWAASCLLHAGLFLGAAVFVQHVRLAPQPPPFTWNVSMAAPARQAPVPAAPAATVLPSPARPTNPMVSTPSPPVLPKPLPTAVQPIQPSTPIVATSPPAPAPIQESKPIVSPPPVISTAIPPAQSAEPIVHEPVVPQPIEVTRQTTQIEPSPAPPQVEQASSAEMQPVVPNPAPPPPTILPPALSMETPPSSPVEPVAAAPSSEITPAPAASAPLMAALAPRMSGKSGRTDYGWLSETILRRVEELKRYPAEARLDRAEGKVVLKAVILDDGSVDNVEVFHSSGYRSLDLAAVELMKQATPFQLPHPLGKSKVTVKIPMSYRLDR